MSATKIAYGTASAFEQQGRQLLASPVRVRRRVPVPHHMNPRLQTMNPEAKTESTQPQRAPRNPPSVRIFTLHPWTANHEP
eukprot:1663610-Rhodomonas_salina.2